MDHQNPYANVDYFDRETQVDMFSKPQAKDDRDYFSAQSREWANQVAMSKEEQFETVAKAVVTDENSFVGVAATNPSHYNSVPSHLQHWDVVHQMGWDYYLGCATKYIWRAGKKKSAAMDDKTKEIQDLEKAVVYLNKKIEILKG
jgi:hypothetical protein